MKIISEHSKGRKISKDTYQVSAMARAAKALDKSIVDSTLGTFFYDDGSFSCHKSVKKVLDNLNDREKFLYATSDGGHEYEEAVKKWFFGKTLEEIEKNMYLKVVPTPGGTGALYSNIFNSLDPGETILIPEPCWGPFLTISKNIGLNCKRFKLFKDDKFDLNELIEKCEKVRKEQNKLVVLLNDPCNNPTGYSLTVDEIDKLINYFNTLENFPVTFIYDTAYIDMASEGYDKIRERLTLFCKANNNILITVCFSASKTMFIYGQRLGAQIILSKDKETVNEFFSASVYTARSTWSNCNNGMIKGFVKIVNDEEITKELLSEIKEVSNTLKGRSDIFIKEAKEVGLEMYPYGGGFFITVPCNNNELVFEKLIEEEKVYLSLTDNAVRVAVCSVPTFEMPGLALKIKRVIEKYS